jgi:phage virion morphogenesis protein
MSREPLAQLKRNWPGLLASMDSKARRTLARQIAKQLQASQQQRIRDQMNPDGTAFATQPDARPEGPLTPPDVHQAATSQVAENRSQPGQRRRQFVGQVERIAAVHQYGLRDKVEAVARPKPATRRANCWASRSRTSTRCAPSWWITLPVPADHLSVVRIRLTTARRTTSQLATGTLPAMDEYAEHNRLIESLLRLGTIAQVQARPPRVRVQSGQLTTDWRPWFSVRAGTTSEWNPPSEGEQCLLLCCSGDPATGFVLLGIRPTNSRRHRKVWMNTSAATRTAQPLPTTTPPGRCPPWASRQPCCKPPTK